jgi:RecA-family ATPase
MTPTTPVTNPFADLRYSWAAPTAQRLFGATKVDANTPISDLPTLARALGGEIRGNQILAPGPGHSAVDRSLAVKLDPAAPDGFFVHSFANDDLGVCRDYVREKCGLPAFKSNSRSRATRSELDALFASACAETRDRKIGRHRATYQYTDETGELLYEVLRYEPKTFRQRRPDGNGGWIWQLGDVRRVPYRLPRLLQYPDATTFVCEGEKDVGAVAALNLCATTVAGGKWTDDCVKALAGRDIIILEDADAAGRKKALAAAHALHGSTATIRIVRLPGLTGDPFNKDASDWLDADSRNAGKLVDVCFDVPIWEPPNPENRTEETAENTSAESEDGTATEPAIEGKTEVKGAPLTFIRLIDWHNRPVPEREWVVLNRVPLKNVTLLSGEGSVGKTILSLQLCVATVLARDWIGAMPNPGPVVAICCEDDADELHRRLDAIVRHYGASFADLADLHILSLAGRDALLTTPRRDGLMTPTKLFARVTEAAATIKPRLILLDNSADVFGGNENDRAQVRQFIGMLRGLAMTADAGLLLTSHPSLTGIATGTGLSGSTAWNASVRSRLYLKRATTAKDEEPDPNLRVLEVMKNNYGPVGETMMLRWKDGLFLPTPTLGSFEKLGREQKVDELFLMLLNRWNEQGRNVSEKHKANSYAPGRFAEEPEAKADHVSKRELAEGMERLFRANRIRSEPYGPPSRDWSRLVRT